MALPDINWTTLTDEDLRALADRLAREQQARALPKQMDALNQEYLTATGRGDGTAWVQPQGGHDAYPKGHTVMVDGKTYRSKVPANVWPPGQDPNGALWEAVTPAVVQGEWAAGMDVTVGQIVTYEGQSYRCVQAHRTQAGWTPPAVPALWAVVAAAGTASTRR